MSVSGSINKQCKSDNTQQRILIMIIETVVLTKYWHEMFHGSSDDIWIIK